jgi:hypothetical protein
LIGGEKRSASLVGSGRPANSGSPWVLSELAAGVRTLVS